jgi:hypothetical protein
MTPRGMAARHSRRTIRGAAGLAGAILLLVSCRETTPAQAPRKVDRELLLLTPLPLMWSESFGLDQPGSPALKQLEQEYKVTAVDLPSQLPDRGLLLAAQPRALPAEELVKLDRWVRDGGRVLVLADPALDWHSERPLGDPQRPPIAFADTGLLRHWGLGLEAPDERGPRQSTIGGEAVLTASPGTLVRLGGACTISDGGLVASCRLGRGRAMVIADADFLNLGPGGLDGPTDDNLPALVSQLAKLSR